MSAYRESTISEIEVVFTRLPRRAMVAPMTPTSEMPLTILDEARRMAMPTEIDYAYYDEVDEEDVETEPARAPFDVHALRDTSPAWTAAMPSPVQPFVNSTVPLARDVVREAEHIAATIRAHRQLPRVSPCAPRLEAIPYHELRQPPPTWPPSAPIVIVPPKRVASRRETGAVVAALVVSTLALAAGAATLLYALAM